MRPMRIALRFWLAATSVLSFLAGWIMLAHSPKPAHSVSTSAGAPLAALAPMSMLAPLAPLDLSGPLGNVGVASPQFPLQQLPPRVSLQMPFFSTGGS
jgi:hypothetical protein